MGSQGGCPSERITHRDVVATCPSKDGPRDHTNGSNEVGYLMNQKRGEAGRRHHRPKLAAWPSIGKVRTRRG